MKTIISSILIITGMTCLNSCRQQDDEQPLTKQALKKGSLNEDARKNSDSVKANEKDLIPKDPPPKDGGQWRLRN
ncbi:hypothetical protein ATE47_01415 [Chryseobacterium sp. IHB B 17019]|uniref:hypothetical protein n=1 Tax=Chryseobacterium sp. IHB B 17019 TaxID=1721091 RepID=UPI00071ED1F5|nr:hypothetical protein [Chryseobacterium sp. IHB B 17019]ALR29271.1 hypothetical protein ATE47_01415 [Chryseobacterium sp. IHB B 17019]